MRRIIYLNPFSNAEITGGIKTAFRHVELLQSLGIDARVFAPGGKPRWFDSTAALESAPNPMTDRESIVVFPEALAGPLEQAARAPSAAAKVLLCQNQYNVFNDLIPKFTYAQLGFTKLLTVSDVARGFLERVLAPAKFQVLPVWVDEALFFPRRKELRIAVVPRKLMVEYLLIRRIFHAKFPQLRRIPWDVIADKSESEVAEVLGRAMLLLSLSSLESVGLVALEAMASGCVVVGFHGYGGLEYATDSNGVWTRPDYLEETADALAAAVTGIERGEGRWQRLRTGAEATARRFGKSALQEALKQTFSGLQG